jgi:hypothetical protein
MAEVVRKAYRTRTFDYVQAFRMAEAGEHDREIALHFGVSESAVSSARKNYGVTLGRNRSRMCPAHEAGLIALYIAGYCDKWIALACNRKRDHVTGWRNRRGLPVNREKRWSRRASNWIAID